MDSRRDAEAQRKEVLEHECAAELELDRGSTGERLVWRAKRAASSGKFPKRDGRSAPHPSASLRLCVRNIPTHKNNAGRSLSRRCASNSDELS